MIYDPKKPKFPISCALEIAIANLQRFVELNLRKFIVENSDTH